MALQMWRRGRLLIPVGSKTPETDGLSESQKVPGIFSCGNGEMVIGSDGSA